MKQSISLVTLAVEDLERSLAFYRDGLGWTASFTNDDIAFFQLNGFAFSIFKKDGLAEDFDGEVTLGGRAIALAHNVPTRGDVDALLGAISQLPGGRIIKPPVERTWGGYSGYFEDPDQHIWEIGWNPHWKVTDDGFVTI